MIREITSDSRLKDSLEIIKDSFITVANELNLNKENCPAHPAFIGFRKLIELKEKGVRMFGMFYEDRQVGFVAIEKADDVLYYMEKLAVLREYRHRGFGKELVDFVLDYVKKRGGNKISIGIIDESSVLKDWYKELGFVETGTRQFEHLPFLVCFMEKNID